MRDYSDKNQFQTSIRLIYLGLWHETAFRHTSF